MDDEDRRITMAIISGAAEAIEFKEKNPLATKDQVVQHVTDNTKQIREKIDDPL